VSGDDGPTVSGPTWGAPLEKPNGPSQVRLRIPPPHRCQEIILCKEEGQEEVQVRPELRWFVEMCSCLLVSHPRTSWRVARVGTEEVRIFRFLICFRQRPP
jgi:hypothetical protein